MSKQWYYVKGKDRIGPVDAEEIKDLFARSLLLSESFVWTQGFDNWKRLADVPELKSFEEIPEPPTPFANNTFDWSLIDEDHRIFTVKIGRDRNGVDTEYGPYSLNLLKKFFNENRINAKTLLFAPGMEDWTMLADIPNFSQIFATVPPIISDEERRSNNRKPFVARVLFHDNKQVLEAFCRDISIGGMQLLVSSFPGKVGDKVALNVHPDNTAVRFVASGVVVRLLEGGQGFSLRFNRLTKEAEEIINSYIKK